MGLDQYAHLRQKPDEEKFYWRKHARLQTFMAREFVKQNKDKIDKHVKEGGAWDLSHLGFNCGEGGVQITTDVLDKLEKQVEEKYYENFATDGFFWGQQFQEEACQRYEKQDKEFIKWAREELKKGNEVVYDCSW